MRKFQEKKEREDQTPATPLDAQASEFEYFSYFDTLIRISFDDQHQQIAAHVFDPDTQALISKPTYMSLTLDDPHCDEINKDEFDKLCHDQSQAVLRIAPNPSGPRSKK